MKSETILKLFSCTNLVEKSMVLKTIIYVCQVLVMQLDYFSNKNLMTKYLSKLPGDEKTNLTSYENRENK